MSELKVTLIDVGWGDSVLIESIDANNQSHYGLIDSNDTTYERSSLVFLKKFFKIKSSDLSAQRPVFDFVVMSHDHRDHGSGLKEVIKYFGTQSLWYPKVHEDEASTLGVLLYWARRYGGSRVDVYRAIHDHYDAGCLGDAEIDILWPEEQGQISDDPNNNSIVMVLTLGQVSFVLTGDAEGEVWEKVVARVPPETHMFKVPHHGSVNGAVYRGDYPWLDHMDQFARKPALAISSHEQRFGHPHKDVVDEIANRKYTCFRTDENYHLTFSTKGQKVEVKYSRV